MTWIWTDQLTDTNQLSLTSLFHQVMNTIRDSNSIKSSPSAVKCHLELLSWQIQEIILRSPPITQEDQENLLTTSQVIHSILVQDQEATEEVQAAQMEVEVVEQSRTLTIPVQMVRLTPTHKTTCTLLPTTICLYSEHTETEDNISRPSLDHFRKSFPR